MFKLLFLKVNLLKDKWVTLRYIGLVAQRNSL